MCAIDGWGSIAGFTNALFDEDGPVIFEFSTVEKAHEFTSRVEQYFNDEVMAALKVKSVFIKAEENKKTQW